MLSVSAAAVPAKKGIVRTVTQADGTKITLTLVGDERHHSYVTTDGLTVSKLSDGNYYYRSAEGVSNVIAHDVDIRSADELSFIKANRADMNLQAVAKSAVADGVVRNSRIRSVAAKASQVPSTGSPRVPIILVQYADYKFKDSDPIASFKSYFSEGSTSAYQYFKDQSNGKYTPQFDLYGPYTLSKNRVSYGGNDRNGDDVGTGAMVGEGCCLADEDIDFSKYDNDNDGICDVVIVLYAGDGEASSKQDDADDSVWPVQWDLGSSDYGKNLTLDGVTVSKFAVFNELYGDLSKIDGIGVFCHEFSHCLDLPDFYDTQYGPHFGMGPWSVLDSGCYNNAGYTPIGYSAYEKSFMNWITLEEGEKDTQYTLPIFNQKSESTDRAIKITNPDDENDYYILENRALQGWDRYMSAEGMMITHVVYDQTAWYWNVVNNEDLQRMTIIPADGTLKLELESYGYNYDSTGLSGDLWPYGKATELTSNTTPVATVYSGTSAYGSAYTGKPIRNITRNDDGTVSFFLGHPQETIATPKEVSHTINSATSATINWAPGDSNDVTYTVELSQNSEELVNSTDFNDDYNWWTTGGNVSEKEGNGVYLGSNNRTGSLTSKNFTTGEDGLVTVKFTAKYYDKGSSIKVSLIQSNSTVDSKTIKTTEDFADYAVLLTGKANTSMKIKFETLQKKQRVYLSKSEVYLGDATDTGTSSGKLTYSDLTENSLTVTGLEENGTYKYRVKAVPVDTDNYVDSAWSEKYTFTLADQTAVTDINMTADDATAEYYTLQGIRLSGAPTAPGLYISRRGNKVSKVLVK